MPETNNRVIACTATLPDYKAACLASGQAPGSVRTRLSYLHRWAATMGDLDNVTVSRIDQWLAWGSQRWDANSARSASSAVRSWLAWAHRAGHTNVPAPDLVPVPGSRRGEPRPVPRQVILEALKVATERDQLMIRLAATMGLRCGEISVVHTRDVMPGKLIVHGKGGKDRAVPMPETVRAAIAAKPAGWVFPSVRNESGHLRPLSVSVIVAEALPDGYTAHQLRHYYGTTVYQNGGTDLLATQRLLGHASPETTMVYAAATTDAMRLAAAAADL